MSLQNLQQEASLQSFWKEIGGYVKNGGAIDILSCDVGINTEGMSMIAQIDALVDDVDSSHFVSINASSNKTGSADLGGDWYLEVGHVDAVDRYFQSDKIQNWEGVLDTAYRVANINSGVAGSNPDNITQFGSKAIFTATTASGGNELWITDGTSSGTVLLKDINVGGGSSSPHDFVVLNGTAYFAANDGSGDALWKTDGTTGGTVKVKDINAAGSDVVDHLTVMGMRSISPRQQVRGERNYGNLMGLRRGLF